MKLSELLIEYRLNYLINKTFSAMKEYKMKTCVLLCKLLLYVLCRFCIWTVSCTKEGIHKNTNKNMCGHYSVK